MKTILILLISLLPLKKDKFSFYDFGVNFHIKELEHGFSLDTVVTYIREHYNFIKEEIYHPNLLDIDVVRGTYQVAFKDSTFLLIYFVGREEIVTEVNYFYNHEREQTEGIFWELIEWNQIHVEKAKGKYPSYLW